MKLSDFEGRVISNIFFTQDNDELYIKFSDTEALIIGRDDMEYGQLYAYINKKVEVTRVETVKERVES